MFAMVYVTDDVIYLTFHNYLEIYYNTFSRIKKEHLLIIYHGFHKQKYVNYTLYFTGK